MSYDPTDKERPKRKSKRKEVEGQGDLFGRTEQTVRAARERLFSDDVFSSGSNCPCCGQFVKLYARRLNAGMVAGLIWIVRASIDGAFVHLPSKAPRQVVAIAGEFARLEHWGLVQQEPNADTGKTHSGSWRPTRLGIDFAMQRVKVPTHVLLFNQSVYGFKKETFGVIKALERGRFNYRELMGDYLAPA